MGGQCWGGVLHTLPDGQSTRYEVSYREAEEVCRAAGARLCTEPEVSAGSTRGTGCGLDNRLIWTSTECANGEFCSSGHFLRLGNGQPIPSSRSMPRKQVFGVRCCADEIAAATEDRNLLGLSEKPCILINRDGQNFVFRQGQNDVCAGSKISGECHGDGGREVVDSHSYSDAVDVCTSVGARLCTSIELVSGLAKGTECGLDTSKVWSSTPCGNDMFETTIGGGDGLSECLPSAGSAGVRCCADAVVFAAASGSDLQLNGASVSLPDVKVKDSSAAGTVVVLVASLLAMAVIAVAAIIVHRRKRHALTVDSTHVVPRQAKVESEPAMKSSNELAWTSA